MEKVGGLKNQKLKTNCSLFYIMEIHVFFGFILFYHCVRSRSYYVATRLRATGLPYIASADIKSSGNAQHSGTDTTALLIIIQVQRFRDTNCYEAWRHISCGNTINIIYVTTQ